MADVLVDTDVFIDHLRGAVELKLGKHRLHYSVITRAELFAGTAATNVVAVLWLAHSANCRLTGPSPRAPAASVVETGLRLPMRSLLQQRSLTISSSPRCNRRGSTAPRLRLRALT